MSEEINSSNMEVSQEVTPEETPDFSNKFELFGLADEVMNAVVECGFREPSPIQQQAIPLILQGHDVIGQAHTGTGKTAAFGLPAISMLQQTGNVEILVITPTRELAMQVSDELYRFGRSSGVNTTTVYGGQSYNRQFERIGRGTPIVVGTPGRLLDILKSGKADKMQPSIVILDEADEMLDMGFLEDIQSIFEYLPEQRQTLLFSATMPETIKKLAGRILKDPVHVSVMKTNEKPIDIDQKYYVIDEHERDAAVIRLIDSFEPKKSIIFCRTKKEVDRIATMLIGRGYSAKGLHGDLEQHQREEVISSFREGRIYNLVATDVAARGLDVSDVTHVFNFHIPFDSESYVHRIGRTGRAGKSGVAVTLINPKEYNSLSRIIRDTKSEIKLDFIPTLYELRDEKLEKLVEQIVEYPINKKAYEVLESLYQLEGGSDLLAKLISMLLDDKSQYDGPKMIGLSKKRVERMIENEEAYRKERRKQRFGGARDGRRRDGGRRRDDGGSWSRDGRRDGRRRDDDRREGGGRDWNRDRNRDDRNRDDRREGGGRDWNRDRNRDDRNRDDRREGGGREGGNWRRNRDGGKRNSGGENRNKDGRRFDGSIRGRKDS